MEKIMSDTMRDQLLSQMPQPENLAAYREHVAATIEKAERRVQAQRRITTAFWIFCAASATAYLWFGSSSGQFPRAPFLACIFFLWGGVELLRHSIASLQVELQKDMKHLQVQVLELRSSLMTHPPDARP
jgi:type VI protein secretion system component VasF